MFIEEFKRYVGRLQATGTFRVASKTDRDILAACGQSSQAAMSARARLALGTWISQSFLAPRVTVSISPSEVCAGYWCSAKESDGRGGCHCDTEWSVLDSRWLVHDHKSSICWSLLALDCTRCGGSSIWKRSKLIALRAGARGSKYLHAFRLGLVIFCLSLRMEILLL